LENVRRHGFIFAGPIEFAGVARVVGTEPRVSDDAGDPGPVPLQAGLTIRAARWRPAALDLDCAYQSWPGDVLEPSYHIEFTAVVNRLRPSLGKTLRARLGFYPHATDVAPHWAGDDPGGPTTA